MQSIRRDSVIEKGNAVLIAQLQSSSRNMATNGRQEKKEI